MGMHDPPHPGGIVKRQCLEPLGLSVTRAAAGLGVTRQALSELVNGRTGVSLEMAMRLSKAFGSTPETWLGMQMAHDPWQARAPPPISHRGDLRGTVRGCMIRAPHGARGFPEPSLSAQGGTRHDIKQHENASSGRARPRRQHGGIDVSDRVQLSVGWSCNGPIRSTADRSASLPTADPGAAPLRAFRHLSAPQPHPCRLPAASRPLRALPRACLDRERPSGRRQPDRRVEAPGGGLSPGTSQQAPRRRELPEGRRSRQGGAGRSASWPDRTKPAARRSRDRQGRTPRRSFSCGTR